MEIPLIDLNNNFTKHLSIPGNHRIFFSGGFGSGKTFFLKKYFEENPSYKAIHLFPVNYSVASNEDIFEYIKYDILFKILEMGVDFEKIDIPYIITFPNFASKNIHNALSPFLNAIPVIGQGLKKVYDELLNLAKKYYEIHDKTQIDDKKNIIEYLSSFAKHRGKLMESDFYTELIIKCIDAIKVEGGEDKPKKCVLILDDLDRIDPEHVFRIFNVLAAHIDNEDEPNKFHFDQIIIVCDIDNFKNIYRNRYGSNVDFYGYVEKFFSREIFDFSLSRQIGGRYNDLHKYIFESSSPIDDSTNYELSFILKNFMLSNQLKIRLISRLNKKKYTYTSKYRWPNERYRQTVWSEGFFKLFDVLKWIFGDIDRLLTACQGTRNPNFVSDEYSRKQLIESLLPVLTFEQHRMRAGTEGSFIFEVDGYKISYKVNIAPKGMEGEDSKLYLATFELKNVCLKENGEYVIGIEDVDYFKLLYHAIKNGQILKILL